jgi:hypothetical protein
MFFSKLHSKPYYYYLYKKIDMQCMQIFDYTNHYKHIRHDGRGLREIQLQLYLKNTSRISMLRAKDFRRY